MTEHHVCARLYDEGSEIAVFLDTYGTVETKVAMKAAEKKPLPFRSPSSNTSAGTARRVGLSRPALCKLPFQGTLAYAASRIPGGKYTFLEYARMCEENRIKALVHRWDNLSDSDRRRVSLEELCEACGVQPCELVGAVAAAAFKFNADVSTLIAAIAHPKVVEASIDRALEAEGIDDRRMLFAHAGFIPSPRGPTVNVLNMARAGVRGRLDPNLPTFEEDMALTEAAIRLERGDEDGTDPPVGS